MDDPELARHRIISSVISEICLNVGFKEIQTHALETLNELMSAFIFQLTFQSKSYAELQSRTEPNCHDIASSLIELGIDIKSFIKYSRTLNSKLTRSKVVRPQIASSVNSPNVLHISNSKPHPNYIYDQFPEFPDPHTYITTETEINNDKDYLKSRELIASQKLNIEKSLVKYKIKSEPTTAYSIFHEDPVKEPTFSLIQNKPQLYPYLNALLPQDEPNVYS